MKAIRYILFAFTAILFTYSCSRVEAPDVVNPDKFIASPIITAACVTDNIAPGLPYLATRSLIDQVTTQSMKANFIRVNEDVKGGDGDDKNDGTYTFGVPSVGYSYQTVNWETASLLEASVISSPDNTPGIFYRSISFDPVQSYSIIARIKDPDALTPEYDTTHFYHTRMVGWYPQTCVLQRNEKGKAVYTRFDNSLYDEMRTAEVMISGRARVGITFTGLDGSKDIMVSNVKEAQQLHSYKASPNTHKSDISPIDGSNIHRSPFGHYTSGPVYSNYFTYKHYLSAVRVWAYADQSQQNLDMWGSINNVVFQDQPQSCKVWLPEELDTEWGEVYEWGSGGNNSIITTPMYGEDVNHSEESYQASYPISLNGAGDTFTKIYLGYALVRPNNPLVLELHTTNGVYVVDIASTIGDGTEESPVVNIFDAGYVYDVMLNLKTTGTIAVLLENESDDHYYDLTTLSELQVGEEKTISAYKYANCYIVSPNDDRYKRLNEAGALVPYEGFCFAATTVGNGSDGIKSYGSQPMYPSTASIDPSYAQLIWETSLGLVSEVELMYGYVRFKVPDPDLEGNAVIGVFDSNNNLLWSWHIWITDYPEDQNFTSGTNTYTLLDRNLGATQARWTGADDAIATYGLYYQWGRKDPSMGPMTYNYSQINLMCGDYYDYSSRVHHSTEVKQFSQPSMKDGVENPMYLILPTMKTQTYDFNWLYENNNILWGASTIDGVTSISKTIYDPCPFGYRVSASELNTLVSSSEVSSTDTYGQIRSVGGEDFYFPYAGFKGVDRGLNSIVGEWKYVGRKGDYQSALYDGTSLHRSRMYISKDDEWKETGVGTYTGYTNMDYTNRRTAASVRCVKINDYGIVSSSLNVDPFMVCGSTLDINMSAQSSGSEISTVTLNRIYKLVGSDVEYTEEVYSVSPSNSSSFNHTFQYTVPAETEFISTGKYQDEFRFELIVTNKLGVSHFSSVTTRRLQFSADFTSWITVTPLTGVSRDEPVIGQPVTLEVTLKCSSTFGSIKINGSTANGPTSPSLNAQGLYEGKYRVTTDFDVAGNIEVPITVMIASENKELIRNVPVWGIEKGTAVSGISGFDNSKFYLIQHINYQTTYISSKSNTTLGPQSGADYASLFSISVQNTGQRSFRALNTKVDGSISGYNTTALSLATSATTYYLKDDSNPYRITSSSGSDSGTRYYFWTQQSNGSFGTVNIRYRNSYNDAYRWNFYPAVFIDPDTL